MELTKEQIMTEALIASEEYSDSVNEAFDAAKNSVKKIKSVCRKYMQLCILVGNKNCDDQEKRKRAAKIVFAIHGTISLICVGLTASFGVGAVIAAAINGLDAFVAGKAFFNARRKLKNQEAQKEAKVVDAAINDAEKMANSKSEDSEKTKKSFNIIRKIWNWLKGKFTSSAPKEDSKQESLDFDMFNSESEYDNLIEAFEAVDNSIDNFFTESEETKKKIVKKLVADHIELFKKNPKKFMNIDILNK